MKLPSSSLTILDRLSPGRIIAAAILLRLVFAFSWAVFLDPQEQDVPLRGDTYEQAGADGYVQIAYTLLNSGEYAFEAGSSPAHNRPPVPPVLLALFGAWSADYWYFAWFIGSALLHLVMLLVLRALARDHGFGEYRTRLLLLFAGFHPYLVFIHKTTTFINPAIVLLTLTFWLFLRIPGHRTRYGVLTGISCGLGALTHGTFLLLPAVFAVLLSFRRDLTPRRRAGAAALVALVALLFVTPWTLRNYRTFDMVIPVVTGNGYHYWKGDAQYFGGEYQMAAIYRERTGDSLRVRYYGAEDPGADAVLWQAAVEDMRSRPWIVPARIAVGYFAYFAPWDAGTAKAVVSALLNFPLLIFIGVSFHRARRAKKLAFPEVATGVLALYVVTAFAFFLSYGSYFNMILPILLFLAVRLAYAPRRHLPRS